MNRFSCSTLVVMNGVAAGSLAMLSFGFAEEPAYPTTAPTVAPAPSTQPTSIQIASYAIGRNFAESLGQAPITLDSDQVLKGVHDALAKNPPIYTQEQVATAMNEVQQQLVAAQQKMIEEEQARAKVEGQANRAAGIAFLESNAKMDGVKSTASGLQYQILKEGEGASPKPTDIVKVHYTGTRIDGTKFDSSVERGEPAEFPLDAVIPGWTEGLQLLKVGGKAKLWIPADLAYGDTPRGSVIKPGDTLVFEVELLGITTPEQPGN